MTHVDAPRVVFGRSASDHVELVVVQRAHPRATDYWDGNWISVRIRVRAGGFDGRAAGDLRTPDLVALRNDLVILHSTLKGEAKLETLEDWVGIRFVGDGLGHIQVKGFLMDLPGTGNRLDFELDAIDQTELPAISTALDELCRRFPVIDDP